MSDQQQQQHRVDRQHDQDLGPRRWFVSLRGGHALSAAEKEELRMCLRRDISPGEIVGSTGGNIAGAGNDRETAEYLDLIDCIVMETSRGKPPCNKCREVIEEFNFSFETAGAIEQCVRDFLTGLGAADESRLEYIWARPTTRLHDHLSERNIDRASEFDIEDCDEFEIMCNVEGLHEALSWDGFAALFDLYLHASNKVLWVSPSVFVFMGASNDVYGRYSLELCIQDDYRVYGHSDDMTSAAKFSDILVRMVSKDMDKEIIALGGMKNISRLSIDADLLEEIWGPVSHPSRQLAIGGASLTAEQTLALVKPRDNRTKGLLSMHSCHFQDYGQALFNCIESNQTPSSLELLHNPFRGYTGLFHFASLLSVNTSLRVLRVADWFLTPDEISALLSGVVANKGLKSVQLETAVNWCPDEHWPLFCDVIRVHPCLQDLTQWCKTGDAPATGRHTLPAYTNMVADSVACNRTLTTLELLSNQHDETVYQARIAPVLSINTYRPRMQAIAMCECDSQGKRRRQALFGRALATMACESHAEDLIFFALEANIDVVVTCWENPCKRPVPGPLVVGDSNKRVKRGVKLHNGKEMSG